VVGLACLSERDTMTDTPDIPAAAIGKALNLKTAEVRRLIDLGVIPPEDCPTERAKGIRFLMGVMTGIPPVSPEAREDLISWASATQYAVDIDLAPHSVKDAGPGGRTIRSAVPEGMLRISEVSEALGITSPQVRSLTEKGILKVAGKTDAGWRYYGPEEVERYRVVLEERRAREAERQKPEGMRESAEESEAEREAREAAEAEEARLRTPEGLREALAGWVAEGLDPRKFFDSAEEARLLGWGWDEEAEDGHGVPPPGWDPADLAEKGPRSPQDGREAEEGDATGEDHGDGEEPPGEPKDPEDAPEDPGTDPEAGPEDPEPLPSWITEDEPAEDAPEKGPRSPEEEGSADEGDATGTGPSDEEERPGGAQEGGHDLADLAARGEAVSAEDLADPLAPPDPDDEDPAPPEEDERPTGPVDPFAGDPEAEELRRIAARALGKGGADA